LERPTPVQVRGLALLVLLGLLLVLWRLGQLT